MLQDYINSFARGEFMIVMDYEDRENEGDLIMGAEFATTEKIAFMLKYTSGILCVPMTSNKAKQLDLKPMVEKNTDLHQTAFTITCDHKKTTTGVSAYDRCMTIKELSNNNALSSDFRKPGHIFPLIARSSLFERRGHTEASIELCRLAKINTVAVIGELMKKDGTMFRYNDCLQFSKKYGIPLITVSDIENEITHIHPPLSFSAPALLNLKVECDNIPIIKDMFIGYWNIKYIDSTKYTYIVASLGLNDNMNDVLCRIHSECFTGEVLGSALCDCSSQLTESMKLIYKEGRGLVIYIKGQEGRGIGLKKKLKSYHIQLNNNIDTFEADKILGYPHDCRNYDEIRYILHMLGINTVKLITNNKQKINSISDIVTDIVDLKLPHNQYNQRYIEAKAKNNNYI